MVKKERQIAAGQFKARCLRLLDEVAASGEPLVVTKHGRPVAKVVPMGEARSLRGSVLAHADLVSPVGEPWNAEK